MPERVEVSIPKDQYEADFMLLDRYQAFSAELLRLSMAGIGVIGFFVKDLEQPSRWPEDVRELTGYGLMLLAASIGGALLHRYFSADGLHYHLRSIRKNGADDLDWRNWKYFLAKLSLGVSGLCFGGGALVLAWGFGTLVRAPSA